jgi:glycine/D-amino acid oxidase-like deaminating enzyme
MTMLETLSQAQIMALGHGFRDAKVLTEGRTRRVFGRRPRRVCVIGAGISGLVTAKVLLEDGFDPLVFEKDAALGGVWSPSRTYPGLCANNTRDTYAFSDHPYPPTAGMFPSAEHIREPETSDRRRQARLATRGSRRRPRRSPPDHHM